MRIRFMERLLMGAGIFLLTGLAAAYVYGWRQQASGLAALSAEARVHHSAPATAEAVDVVPVEGELFGRIAIPRLGVNVAVFEGTSDPTLLRGAGRVYLPESERGDNIPHKIALAAHRDTFFRPLRDVKTGDEILVETPHGARRYEVDNIEVVKPSAVEVLHPEADPALVLITCYPFSFIGHAPDRYIVHAKMIPTQLSEVTY